MNWSKGWEYLEWSIPGAMRLQPEWYKGPQHKFWGTKIAQSQSTSYIYIAIRSTYFQITSYNKQYCHCHLPTAQPVKTFNFPSKNPFKSARLQMDRCQNRCPARQHWPLPPTPGFQRWRQERWEHHQDHLQLSGMTQNWTPLKTIAYFPSTSIHKSTTSGGTITISAFWMESGGYGLHDFSWFRPFDGRRLHVNT